MWSLKFNGSVIVYHTHLEQKGNSQLNNVKIGDFSWVITERTLTQEIGAKTSLSGTPVPTGKSPTCPGQDSDLLNWGIHRNR